MGQTTKLEQVEVASLRPYERNAKLHPQGQSASMMQERIIRIARTAEQT